MSLNSKLFFGVVGSGGAWEARGGEFDSRWERSPGGGSEQCVRYIPVTYACPILTLTIHSTCLIVEAYSQPFSFFFGICSAPQLGPSEQGTHSTEDVPGPSSPKTFSQAVALPCPPRCSPLPSVSR